MKFLIGNNLIYILFLIFGLIIFFYGYKLFSNYAIEEYTEEIEKISIPRFLKEYFFYVLFLISAIIVGFLIISGVKYQIIYYLIITIGLFTYLIDFSDFLPYKKNNKIEIGMVRLKKINKSQLNNFNSYLNTGLILFILTAIIGFFLSKNPNSFYVGLTSPILFSSLYWIGYSDKFEKIILERFLIIIMISGFLINIIFASFFVENLIILFTFGGLSLFVIGVINKINKKDILGYMDFPVAFSIGLNMFFYSTIFIGILLIYTWLEGFFEKFIKNNNDTGFSVGLFGSSGISYVLSLIITLMITK